MRFLACGVDGVFREAASRFWPPGGQKGGCWEGETDEMLGETVKIGQNFGRNCQNLGRNCQNFGRNCQNFGRNFAKTPKGFRLIVVLAEEVPIVWNLYSANNDLLWKSYGVRMLGVPLASVQLVRMVWPKTSY